MSSINWDPSLETGDALVDQQHKTIHRLFGELESAADDAAEIMRVLEYLTEHVVMHFATEEDLMTRERFPRELTESHVAEHRKLTDGVRQRVLEFRDGRLKSTGQLIEFLRCWLESHVHECDRLLVNYMSMQGAAARLPEPWASSASPAA